MEISKMFGDTIGLYKRSLDLRSARHSVLASNIANMETPKYQPFDVLVEKELAKEAGPVKGIGLEATHSRHIPLTPLARTVTPVRSSRPGGPMEGEASGVDIDREMAHLSENGLLYDVVAQSLARKFQGIRDAIQGGK